MARPLLADPDFVNKAAAGTPELINTCIACNQALYCILGLVLYCIVLYCSVLYSVMVLYSRQRRRASDHSVRSPPPPHHTLPPSVQACLDHTFQMKRASCLVNPRAGYEAELFYKKITAPPLKLAVVGAGIV